MSPFRLLTLRLSAVVLPGMLLRVKDGPVVGSRLLLLLEVALLSRRAVPPARLLEDFFPFSDGMDFLCKAFNGPPGAVLPLGRGTVYSPTCSRWGGGLSSVVEPLFQAWQFGNSSGAEGCQRRGSGEASLLLMRSSAELLR